MFGELYCYDLVMSFAFLKLHKGITWSICLVVTSYLQSDFTIKAAIGDIAMLEHPLYISVQMPY